MKRRSHFIFACIATHQIQPELLFAPVFYRNTPIEYRDFVGNSAKRCNGLQMQYDVIK